MLKTAEKLYVVISLSLPPLSTLTATTLTTKSVIAPLLFETANNSVAQIVMIVAFKDVQKLFISTMTEQFHNWPQLHLNTILNVDRNFTQSRLQHEHSYCQ